MQTPAISVEYVEARLRDKLGGVEKIVSCGKSKSQFLTFLIFTYDCIDNCIVISKPLTDKFELNLHLLIVYPTGDRRYERWLWIKFRDMLSR